MESLLDAADALAQLGDEPHRPDFVIPEEYAVANEASAFSIASSEATGAPTSPPSLGFSSSSMVLRESPSKKGCGWFATTDIAAGTVLLVAKPVAMVMDWENDEEEEEDANLLEQGEDNQNNSMEEDEKEPRLNELLLVDILRKLSTEPDLWKTKISTLFPRNEQDLSTLPAWICHSDSVFLEVEALLSTIEAETNLPVKEISKRLPLIIRCNILSVETCAELLNYPGQGGHLSLAGVGLYHLPSFFNHSAQPVVSRWAVGDVMGFVANRDVRADTELCISYIEHDVLCEPAWRRNLMLSMDFQDTDAQGSFSPPPPATTGVGGSHDGPDMPVVDADVQNELMSMDPFERLSAIDALVLQARGEERPTEYAETTDSKEAMVQDDTQSATWFQCDEHNLNILKAITLDGMGQTAEALKLWEGCGAFVDQKLPTSDESGAVIRAQAALCAWHAGQEAVARQHASRALAIHELLFGGGVARFRRRLERDLRLSLRPTTNMEEKSPQDELWPLVY